MSKGYKFGQIVGIIVGVIAGSMLIRAVIGPSRRDVVVIEQYPYQPQAYIPQQPQGTVFEQALSLQKST